MGMVANVLVKDATHTLVQHLKGNVEYKQLDLVGTPANGALFKKGAHYTATDGHTTWKVVFVSHEPTMLHFQIVG